VRGGNIGQNCLGGHKKKTCSRGGTNLVIMCPRGVNKSSFVSKWVRKIPVFVQGVTFFVSGGGHGKCPPPSSFFIALTVYQSLVVGKNAQKQL